MIDSLRADHLGYMGYERETSPWMDVLAAEAANFSLAVSPSNATRRSVASYFTGKPYSALHHDPEALGIPEDETTMAELFREAGFKTSAWTANGHVSSAFGYAQGFDRFRIVKSLAKYTQSIDEIIAILRRSYQPSGEREFIYVHTMDVHHPYRPPLPYAARWQEPYTRAQVREGNMYLDNSNELAVSIHPYWSELHGVQDEDIELIEALYDAAIRYTDEKLPDLLDALDYEPKRDLLVITSDHGEQFVEHGFWGHGHYLLSQETHVPLIIAHDSIQGRDLGKPSSLLDLMPTFCELFDLPRPDGLLGESLVPALHGDAQHDRLVYTEGNAMRNAGAAVTDGEYLYWLWTDRFPREPWHSWPFEERLYRIDTDPACETNLIENRPEVADRLNEALRDMNEHWREYTRDVVAGSDAGAQFGPELVERILSEEAGAPTAARSAGGETRALRSRPTMVRYQLKDLVVGAAHHFEFEYDLTAGRLELSIGPEGGASTDWSYTCAITGRGSRKLAATFLPSSEESILTIGMPGAGAAELGPVSVRRILLPDVKPVSLKAPATEIREDIEGLNAQERMELEALGYLE